MKKLLLLVPLLLASCDSSLSREPGTVVQRDDQPDVVYVAPDDAEMASAIENAQTSLDAFVGELAEPRPGASYGVKVRFENGETTEFIWLTDIAFENDEFRGVAGNEGVDVEVSVGQAFLVPKDRVVDWLIVEGGKYRGGFTVRLIRDRMSPADRQRTDDGFGALPE